MRTAFFTSMICLAACGEATNTHPAQIIQPEHELCRDPDQRGEPTLIAHLAGGRRAYVRGETLLFAGELTACGQPILVQRISIHTVLTGATKPPEFMEITSIVERDDLGRSVRGLYQPEWREVEEKKFESDNWTPGVENLLAPYDMVQVAVLAGLPMRTGEVAEYAISFDCDGCTLLEVEGSSHEATVVAWQ